jgi:hypothetical protein
MVHRARQSWTTNRSIYNHVTFREDLGESLFRAIRACKQSLRITEPASGALERGAAAVEQLFDLSVAPPDSGFMPEDVAKVVLDAAGVPYAE